jgi:hypothetical protein
MLGMLSAVVFLRSSHALGQVAAGAATQLLNQEPPQCSPLGSDRNNPNLGGCCPPLHECQQARAMTSPHYCNADDPNYDKSCWSTIVICSSGPCPHHPSTPLPTGAPTANPTQKPTPEPSPVPTHSPTQEPTTVTTTPGEVTTPEPPTPEPTPLPTPDPPTPDPVWCNCSSPDQGAAGHNQYTCTDGTNGACSSTQSCLATSPFVYGEWSSVCATTCKCTTPSTTTTDGQNEYTCTDGTTSYCASDQSCYTRKPFVYGQWRMGCATPQVLEAAKAVQTCFQVCASSNCIVRCTKGISSLSDADRHVIQWLISHKKELRRCLDFCPNGYKDSLTRYLNGYDEWGRAGVCSYDCLAGMFLTTTTKGEDMVEYCYTQVQAIIIISVASHYAWGDWEG